MFGLLPLNIRQKVVLGLTVSMLVMGAIGGFSFHYLREIERKLHVVEVADDLSSNILEIRRYEKNYLLYGSTEDFQANRRYVQTSMDVLARTVPEVQDFRGAPLFYQLEQALTAYNALMETMLAQGYQHRGGIDPALEEQLRESGKALVKLSQQIVGFERQRILNIITALKTQLLSSLTIFLIMGASLIPIVARKIIRPLRVIERTTLRIAQGDFTLIPVLTTRDETQRVVEAFNRMISELERRQDQLFQAKKLSSLGILASGIAHQLNNPLNNISTSCQIVIEEFDQGDREFLRKMLRNIEQEVYRARDIVKGLLEFSRVKEFCPVPTALAEVVNRSVRLISSQVPPGVTILKEVPGELVLDLDTPQMEQVFLNLLMNAIQAIETPPGEIRIRARPDIAQAQVVITVEDTGVGISARDLERVFDPFFTTKGVGVGTGLGLSVAYGIIQKHQGAIAVESREGEGTRFIIRLPAKRG